MTRSSFHNLSSVPVGVYNGLSSWVADLASGQLCKNNMTLAHAILLNVLSVNVSYIFSQEWRCQTFLHSFLDCQKPIKLDLLAKRERDSKLKDLDLLQRQLSEAFKCLYSIKLSMVS